MNDLGSKAESPMAMPEKSNEPYYPTLCLRGDAMEEFLGKQKVDVGDEFEVKFKVRVSGLQKSKHGKSIDLEVLESEELDLEGGEKETEDEEDAD